MYSSEVASYTTCNVAFQVKFSNLGPHISTKSKSGLLCGYHGIVSLGHINKHLVQIHPVNLIFTKVSCSYIRSRVCVTCSEKRDHSRFFMKIEFISKIDSSVFSEYNGEGFMQK